MYLKRTSDAMHPASACSHLSTSIEGFVQATRSQAVRLLPPFSFRLRLRLVIITFSSASTKIHHNGGCFCWCTAQNGPEQASQARWDRPKHVCTPLRAATTSYLPISFRFKALTFCHSTFLHPWHLASDEIFSSPNPLMIILLMSADGFVA
jgi:hypothetical protein